MCVCLVRFRFNRKSCDLNTTPFVNIKIWLPWDLLFIEYILLTCFQCTSSMNAIAIWSRFTLSLNIKTNEDWPRTWNMNYDRHTQFYWKGILLSVFCPFCAVRRNHFESLLKDDIINILRECTCMFKIRLYVSKKVFWHFSIAKFGVSLLNMKNIHFYWFL